MIQVIKKSEQFNDLIFNGQFRVNKPVFNGKSNVQPYSNLFYWSNGYVDQACEFGLHPHQGFEIMTFLMEGKIEHYDTSSQVWTPLHAGDFQIIQSNSGIKHQERIAKNSRAFQIWFDPNYQEAITKSPSYVDYSGDQFLPKIVNGIQTITYLGEGSFAKALTPFLSIKKLILDHPTASRITLDKSMSYTFYVIKGSGTINNQFVEQDDSVRMMESQHLDIDFNGELFYIETPTVLDYLPIWNKGALSN
jgi:redox-sensitive bicupin YhaK (pirin superfamily)